MNVILLERIGNLGGLGEEVDVKAGYARNFLIPQGKAVWATRDNRDSFEDRRVELEGVANEKLGVAEARAGKLIDMTATIVARVGEEGKLYGSVGPTEVARAITEQGVPLSRSEVVMPEGAIRIVGEYEVDIALHADVATTVKVIVVGE